MYTHAGLFNVDDLYIELQIFQSTNSFWVLIVKRLTISPLLGIIFTHRSLSTHPFAPHPVVLATCLARKFKHPSPEWQSGKIRQITGRGLFSSTVHREIHSEMMKALNIVGVSTECGRCAPITGGLHCLSLEALANADLVIVKVKPMTSVTTL